METEVRLIENDKEALDWAIGSVRAALTEAVRSGPLQRVLSARSAAIVWIVIFIAGSVFNVTIALAARLGWQRTAGVLGRCLRGFRYENFRPLAQAMPAELFGLMSLVVVGFCASLYLSLCRRRSAYAAFCCTLALSFLVWLYQLGMPAYLNAISAPHRWRSGLCFILTVAVLAALRPAAGPQASLGARA